MKRMGMVLLAALGLLGLCACGTEENGGLRAAGVYETFHSAPEEYGYGIAVSPLEEEGGRAAFTARYHPSSERDKGFVTVELPGAGELRVTGTDAAPSLMRDAAALCFGAAGASQEEAEELSRGIAEEGRGRAVYGGWQGVLSGGGEVFVLSAAEAPGAGSKPGAA